MTLDQLRVFVAVAERLHMTRAAEALHMTQSAASAAIAALEARHKVRLFDRVGRKLELTEAGRTLLPEARQLLKSAGNAAALLDDLAGLKRGTLAIAASQTISSYWLPQRLARFAETNPQIQLRLTTGNTAQTAEAVVQGAADLGFVEGHVRHPLLTHSAVAIDRMAIYGGVGHALSGKRLRAADLQGAQWVLREEGSGTRAHFEEAMHKAGLDVKKLQIVMALPSNEAVLAAVEKGTMLTAVSELAAGPHLAAGLIEKLEFPLAERRFERLLFRGRSQSRATAAFLAGLSISLPSRGQAR